jgi:hypothetical protein
MRGYEPESTIGDRIVAALRQRRAEREAWVDVARRERGARLARETHHSFS